MSSWWKSTAVVLKSRRLFMAKNSQYELLWCLWESLLQTTVVENFFSLSHLPLTKLLKRPKCSILAISCHFPFFWRRGKKWFWQFLVNERMSFVYLQFSYKLKVCLFFRKIQIVNLNFWGKKQWFFEIFKGQIKLHNLNFRAKNREYFC